MKNFLSNQTLQPVYAVAILLFLFCAAPILSGPRGFGVDIYLLLRDWSGLVTGYVWSMIVVSAFFLVLRVPAVGGALKNSTVAAIKIFCSVILLLVMFLSLMSIRHLAWGWGLWVVSILSLLLIINVILNRSPQVK